MERLQRLPTAILPTFVGTLTLANVYGQLGYTWVRIFFMLLGSIVWLLYAAKLVKYPKVCLEEYKKTIPCALYGAFFIIMAALGAFYYEYIPALGRVLSWAGLCLHVIHILVFTWRNVISHRDIYNTTPSWFVTYNAIMVSSVVGGAVLTKPALTALTWYGICVYPILISVLIWRMTKYEMGPEIYHSKAVVLSPCSLCVVSYLNVIENPNPVLLYVLYACVLASLLYILLKLFRYFSYPFTPGYASLTFPMSIGVVASSRMSGWFAAHGMDGWAEFTYQLSGFQLFITTTIIGYVLIQFAIMAFHVKPAEYSGSIKKS